MDDTYEELRPLAFAIAYRMLGSAGEAEDIVQEAFIRLHRAGDEVESPKAFVTTVVTRLAIDELRSARVRREAYVGSWLPEPLVDESAPAPDEQAELADSLSMAFLLVLETLAPIERAVFLLHDVFDYPYSEIAEIVGKEEANCRQIAARARQRIDAGRPRFDPSREQREELARRFFAALENGEVEGLVKLLAEDVEFAGDGGGKATAVPQPLVGRDRVARFLAALFLRGRRLGGTMQPVQVNGGPGAMLFDADGRLVSVMSVDVAGGTVARIHNVLNPDKLDHLGRPLSDLALRRR